MTCIPYINDLSIEIDILRAVKKDGNCDIGEIDRQIKEKQNLINICKENLSLMSKNSIEYRLYLKILEGKKPSQAVKEIADENYENDVRPTSPSKIWEKNYKKMKKIIKGEWKGSKLPDIL